MSTTPDTTTSDGSANADHQASDTRKVASRNGPWRRQQKTKPLSATMTNETMKFEGKCDDLSGYIYNCADPKQAADMYMNTKKKYPNTSDVNISMGVRWDKSSWNCDYQSGLYLKIFPHQAPRMEQRSFGKTGWLSTCKENRFSLKMSRLCTPSSGGNALMSCDRK